MNTIPQITTLPTEPLAAEVVGSTPAGCSFTEEKRGWCSKGVANLAAEGAVIYLDARHVPSALIVLATVIFLAVIGGFFFGARWGERREHRRITGRARGLRTHSILHRIH